MGGKRASPAEASGVCRRLKARAGIGCASKAERGTDLVLEFSIVPRRSCTFLV